MINVFHTRGARPDQARARASDDFTSGAFRRRNGIMFFWRTTACVWSSRQSARASFRRRTFVIEHRRSRRAREPAMQRPRRTRSRGWGRGDHSEISSKFSLACVMSVALSTALRRGLAEAAPAPVVVERAAFGRATARRRGREAIHGRGSVALLLTLGA